MTGPLHIDTDEARYVFFPNWEAQRGILKQNVFASKLYSKVPIKQFLTLTLTPEMIEYLTELPYNNNNGAR